MTTNTLNISMAETEGALTRLIGLIERRGYAILSLDKTAPSNGETQISVSVSPRDGMRHIDVLSRQISRLIDVRDIYSRPNDACIVPPVHGSAECRPPH